MTHGIQWLQMVDNIVVIVDGNISESGSHKKLLSNDGDFAHFITMYQQQEDTDDEDGEECMHYLFLYLNVISVVTYTEFFNMELHVGNNGNNGYWTCDALNAYYNQK